MRVKIVILSEGCESSRVRLEVKGHESAAMDYRGFPIPVNTGLYTTRTLPLSVPSTQIWDTLKS